LRIRASSRFLRKAKKLMEPHATMLRAVLRRLAVDPRDPVLASHRLKGELDGYWACTVDDDLRLLFRWRKDELFLVNLGSHDQVY
jgi:addiction module RelE/StbE family toxin